jgi:hypothetical protein
MTAPDPEERVRGGGWRRRARGMVADRLGLKVTALAIALLLWFVVRVMHVTTPVIPQERAKRASAGALWATYCGQPGSRHSLRSCGMTMVT